MKKEHVPYLNEFISFLKKRKLYSAFRKALEAERTMDKEKQWHPNYPKDFISYLKYVGNRSWIVSAFTWCYTKQKTDVWNKAHEDWNKVLEEYINIINKIDLKNKSNEKTI